MLITEKWRYNQAVLQTWIIRGLCIAPLLLSIAAWGWSLHCVTHVTQYKKDVCLQRGLMIAGGVLRFYADWGYESSTPDAWSVASEKYSDPLAAPEEFGLLGFGAYYDNSPANIGECIVDFPLWLPIVLSALLSCLVWRKTRSKPVKRAFLVEANPTLEEKAP